MAGACRGAQCFTPPPAPLAPVGGLIKPSISLMCHHQALGDVISLPAGLGEIIH